MQVFRSGDKIAVKSESRCLFAVGGCCHVRYGHDNQGGFFQAADNFSGRQELSNEKTIFGNPIY